VNSHSLANSFIIAHDRAPAKAGIVAEPATLDRMIAILGKLDGDIEVEVSFKTRESLARPTVRHPPDADT
jgi:hypothetical protein